MDFKKIRDQMYWARLNKEFHKADLLAHKLKEIKKKNKWQKWEDQQN